MEIHVSRSLFPNSDENNPCGMNKNRGFQIPLTNESLTPNAKKLEDEYVCRGNLSTPRPRKERSPLSSEADAMSTPTEPNAPIKEKCKSDPRKSSQDMSISGSNKMFDNPNAKILVFEDEGTLAPIGQNERKGLKTAGNSSRRKSMLTTDISTVEKTPKKAAPVAWGQTELDEDSNKIPLISGFNVLVASPDPLSKYHEEISVTHQDFDLAPANSTPRKQTVSKIVKQLHNELDTPPEANKEASRIRHQPHKVAANLFNEESPDGIAAMFNETVSPFKENYKIVTKAMQKISLTHDFGSDHDELQARQPNKFCVDRRPATSPELKSNSSVHHVTASTPERKATKGSRPMPFIKKKATHIGNTAILKGDVDKIKNHSPVPTAPQMGKFRKKLVMCLSPLVETNEIKSPLTAPHQSVDLESNSVSPISRNINKDFEIKSDIESGVSSLSEFVDEMEIFEHRSAKVRNIRAHRDVDIVIDMDMNADNATKIPIKPSRPSMPPSKNFRPKPNNKKDSENRDENKNCSKKPNVGISLMAEGHAVALSRVSELNDNIIVDTQIQRMKFVPMPRRKQHKVEKMKFNPRLEHIQENEEANHPIPRWLTILRKKRNESSRISRKPTRTTLNMDNNCDNSLLSSTILLISDGVQMDGVDPVEKACYSDIAISNSGHPHDDEYRQKLATYFSAPEGVEQVTDYAGFDCIFNRYGSTLKTYVEGHSNINSVVDSCGNNLLHAASYIGWERAVKFLIRRGVSVNHSNNYGVTPLVYAIEFENYESRDYLLKKGAITDV